MEVIIDIPEDHKRVIDNLVEDGKGYLLPHEVENKIALAIRNGKVLSEMTNGEVINEIFPWCCSIRISPPYVSPFYSTFIDGHPDFTEEFWDAKYEGAYE